MSQCTLSLLSLQSPRLRAAETLLSSPQVYHHRTTADTSSSREQLREQHELTQEIGNAITSMPLTEPIDEDELQADLDKLEQEALDEKMLKTGTVPVADSLNSIPSGPNGACKYFHIFRSVPDAFSLPFLLLL